MHETSSKWANQTNIECLLLRASDESNPHFFISPIFGNILPADPSIIHVSMPIKIESEYVEINKK